MDAGPSRRRLRRPPLALIEDQGEDVTCRPLEASSQASADSTPASNEADGSADGRSRSMNGAEQSSLDIGPTSPDGTTRRRSRQLWATPTAAIAVGTNASGSRGRRDLRREVRLTSYAEDSPASPSPSPASAEGRATEACPG